MDLLFPDAISAYTAILSVVTAVLVLAACIQIWQTGILQRAYLRVEPRGVTTINDGLVFIGQIAIVNVGHLPARKVSNEISICWWPDKELSQFPDLTITPRDMILPVQAEMPRGTREDGLSPTNLLQVGAKKGHIYVFGKIEYLDGFSCKKRWLTFCHRYNCKAPRRSDGGISHCYARLHHHHNDGN